MGQYAGQETTINQLDADGVVRLCLLLRGYPGPPQSLAFSSHLFSISLFATLCGPFNLLWSQTDSLSNTGWSVDPWWWWLYLEVGHSTVELIATSTPDLDSILRM